MTARPFTVIDVPQRSPEWFQARAGRITGTCAEALLAKGKGSAEAVDRRDLRLRLVCERLTGQPQDDGNGYVNAAMQRGIDKEAEALAAYEAETRNLVRRTGFIAHNDSRIGCSLDGDIDDFTGILELKCPKSSTHLGYHRDPNAPVKYRPQIMHNLLVTGAQWCDFVSFDDRFPADLQLVIRRVSRADLIPDLTAYELAVRLFLGEVDKEFAAVTALRAAREVA